MIPVIKIEDVIKKIDGRQWYPMDVAQVNDQVVRLALVKGEYHWHKHIAEDELFYVLKGHLVIQLRDEPDLSLYEGQMTVIPKGVEHCPKSEEETYILMFEPFKLESKGD